MSLNRYRTVENAIADVDDLLSATAMIEEVWRQKDEHIQLLKEALEQIRDYGQDQEEGYPREIVYDEFAYLRMVDSYRKCAAKALEAFEKGE